MTAPNWHRKARTLKEWNRVPLSDDHVWPSPREADDQEYSEEEDAEDVSGRGTETDEHVWPSPREEDDQARSEEEDAGDVSGRGSETGTRSNPPGNFK